jgi:hypothetical protein
MRRVRSRAIALLFVLAGCGWVQRHPAVTLTTVVGATIGFGSCEIGDGKTSTCAIFGGGAALFLGGLTALALEFLDTGDHAIGAPPGPELTNGGAIRIHTRTLPPPVLLDAGVAASDGGPVGGDRAVMIDAGVGTDGSAMADAGSVSDSAAR